MKGETPKSWDVVDVSTAIAKMYPPDHNGYLTFISYLPHGRFIVNNYCKCKMCKQDIERPPQ